MLHFDKRHASIHDLKIGDNIILEKTISESDVYMFAGITGDFSPNHVNESYMKKSIYRTRIAQGALVLGFTSAAAAMFALKYGADAVSAGYDRIRFIEAVFFGDTIRTEYKVARIDTERQRAFADIVITNQHGKTVVVAEHILKLIPYNSVEQGGDA